MYYVTYRAEACTSGRPWVAGRAVRGTTAPEGGQTRTASTTVSRAAVRWDRADHGSARYTF